MLENDPNANLNREVPVTPTKPKPATHCQKFIARVLPELQISCFEIKSKDWQAIGELQGSDSFQAMGNFHRLEKIFVGLHL